MVTWLPLESNPEVLTKFIHELGVSKFWALNDVFGMEPEYLEWVPKPVKAVILLCPCSESFEKFCKDEDEKLKLNPPEIPNNIYYMKQYIHNACGTIALLHAVGNNPDIELIEGSKIKKFLEDTIDLSPEKRGEMLQNASTISATHDELAHEGQTEANLNDPVNHHFVAFVEHNGELYELDGRKSFPISHGKTSSETLLEDATKVCKAVIDRDPEDLRFSVIALTPNNN